VGLLEPRGRPAEIHDRQRAVSEIEIQNGGLETVRRFLFLRINISSNQGTTAAQLLRGELTGAQTH
jgi:hypothetical protein